MSMPGTAESAVATLLHRAEAVSTAGDVAAAAANLAAALAIEPGNAVALYGLANMQARAGAPDTAIETLGRAIAVAPWFDLAYADLGGLLADRLDHREARRALRRALALFPGHPVALHNYAMALGPTGIEAMQDAYRRTLAARFDAEADSAYVQRLHYSPSYSAETIFRAHLAWGRRHRPQPAPAVSLLRSAEKGRRLHVAYASADLCRHPVGTLLSAAIAHHDRGEVAVTICDTGTVIVDDVTAALRRMADRWMDLRSVPPAESVRLLRDAQIDVCVDLSGHTPGNILPVLAERVAPIQISWLGYWNTTGVPEIDCLLTCGVEVPPERDRFFVERVVRMPEGRFCYAVPAYAPVVAPPPSERAGVVTFGCFANREVHVAQLDAWAAILARVPRSRLVLRSGRYDDAEGPRLVLEELAGRGVGDAPSRVGFHGRTSHDRLLASYGDIDIALDPFPFSGLMTSLEALTMGVPVVTVGSSRIESRQTLAILARLCLDEFAVSSVEDYVATAVALAGDGPRRRELRAGLRSLVADRLCQGGRFCRGLESVYRRLWSELCDRAAVAQP